MLILSALPFRLSVIVCYRFGVEFEQYRWSKWCMCAMHANHIMQTLIFCFHFVIHTNLISIPPNRIARINPNPNAIINTIFECFMKQVIKINDIKSMNLIARIHFESWFWCNFRFKRPILLHSMRFNSSFFAY